MFGPLDPVLFQGVFLDENASIVRVILRVYFAVALLLVAWIGSWVCVLRPRLGLLRHGHAPVMDMTGWLSAFDAARTMWLTRSNPLGWMGFLMILTGSILTLSDLAVSGFVDAVDFPGRCQLNTSESAPWYVIPPTNWTFGPGATFSENAISNDIETAQHVSRSNGGLDGIYRQIDTSPRFRAENSDVLGSWRCQLTMGDRPKYPYNTTTFDIIVDMMTRGILFMGQNNTDVACTLYGNRTENGGRADGSLYTKDNLILSANDKRDEVGISTTKWDIRGAMQITVGSFIDMEFQPFVCTMQAPRADWVLTWTNPMLLFFGWKGKIWSALYSESMLFGTRITEQNEVVPALESTLNMMTMSVGMIGGLFGRRTDGTSFVEDTSIGCLISRTRIPWPIIATFVLVAVILIFVCVYALVLHLAIERVQKDQIPGASIGPDLRYVPVGFMSWMKRAMPPASSEEERSQINTRRLRNWHLEMSPDGKLQLAEWRATDIERGLRRTASAPVERQTGYNMTKEIQSEPVTPVDGKLGRSLTTWSVPRSQVGKEGREKKGWIRRIPSFWQHKI